jgi:hypothetical protein
MRLYDEAAENHRIAHARRTSGIIGPFGINLLDDRYPSFWPLADTMYQLSLSASVSKLQYCILYTLLKNTGPSSL